MDIIEWLTSWYSKHCDGYWEHDNAIIIETLDNPGWSITIYLEGTILEDLNEDSGLVETSKNDWYRYKFSNGMYKGVGCPLKLHFLISKFREYYEKIDALSNS